MTPLIIVPECYVDTLIAKIIVQGKVNHQMGCNQVANKLLGEFKDLIALGIIDEDRNKGTSHPYIKDFDTKYAVNNLLLKKHKQREHYLIIICPEIENWLLNDAKTVNVNLSEYGLPNDLHGLKKVSKAPGIRNNIGFHKFIKALLRNEAPSITTLKKWLDLFQSNQINTLTI